MNQPMPPAQKPRNSNSNPVLWIVLFISLSIIGAAGYILYAVFDTIRCLNPSSCINKSKPQTIASKYGKFQSQMTQFGIRWFPTYVHFGPDGDTLLVSLCHVQPMRYQFCRIGKYSISKNQWDILPFEEDKTYMEPVFSPDGQWIVATMAGTEEGMAHSRTLRLVKMRPDGTQVQDVISAGIDPAIAERFPYQAPRAGNDIQATSASFSHNGKRLIYWRHFNLREKDAPAFAVLYMMDWETGKETQLAGQKPFFDRHQGRPFLTPDGERFVFSASYADYNVAPEERDFVRKNNFFVANVKDAPVVEGELLQKLQALPVIQQRNTNMLDMDRQGRVLYQGNLEDRKKEGNPVALGIRPANPNYKRTPPLSSDEEKRLYPPLSNEQIRQGAGLRRSFNRFLNDDSYQQGMGAALFLSKPQSAAQDEAVFDVHGAINDAASLSPDSKTLAFIWGGIGPSSSTGLGLLRQGDPMRNTRFIDWPKLDLIPSQPNSAKKP